MAPTRQPSLIWMILLNMSLVIMAQDPSITLVPHGTKITGVRKVTNKRGTVVAFLGIPYALPPIGNLRFKLPEKFEFSNDTISATQFGFPCPQPDPNQLRTSEDCLTMNIWIPELPSAGKFYPVLIFLEGGMFTHGNTAKYPAEDLAAEGLVVVSINYRLNVFGFLSLETEDAPGNFGLWDQTMAMTWVKENIANFGGDTSKTTLMGHGAGGASASMHMVAKPSKGLFSRTIIMSGSAFSPWAISWSPRNTTMSIARMLGCRTHSNSEIMDCLRKREVRDILQAFSRHQKDFNTTEIFAPVVDSKYLDNTTNGKAFFDADPLVNLLKGDLNHNKDDKFTVITGTVENEGIIYQNAMSSLATKSENELMIYINTAFIPRATDYYRISAAWPQARLSMLFQYFENVRDDKSALLNQLLEFFGDAYYKAPQEYWVNAISKHVPTYIYRYSHPTPTTLDPYANATGARHGSELNYLFGPTVYRQEIGVGFNRQDEAVSDLLKRLWLEFAQGGDPTPSPFGFKWEFSTNKDVKYYEIREQLSRVPPPKNRVTFWTKFLPSLERLAKTGPDEIIVHNPQYDSRFKFNSDPTQPYQSIMWVLIAAITVLLVAFILSMASMRRKQPLV